MSAKLLITGATGYIGRELVTQAGSEGGQIICATRTPCPPEHTWLAYDLHNPAPDFPDDIRAVIHLAAETSKSIGGAPEYEIAAAKSLLDRASKANAKFIFISSQTASPTAPSAYGQIKWRIEQEVLKEGGIVIRPGLVYGGPERGLFGRLVSQVRRFPAIPVFLPAAWVQPIHVEDLVTAILNIAKRDDIQGGIFSLGAIQPIHFTRFLKSIADDRLNRFRLLLPLPTAPIQLLGWLLGRALSEKYGLDRILSLIQLPPMPCKESLQRTHLELRPLAQGMYRRGHNRHRHLLREGITLLSYILKTTPKPSLVRRYVYALQRADKHERLFCSNFISYWPLLLSLIDTPADLRRPENQELALRLQFALQIAEASPQGARVFLDPQQQGGPLKALSALTITALKELSWRLLAILCRPFARQLFMGSEIKRET
ncbi:sugar nucleotide-binding protein [Pseudomonas chlororaphis]|nr:sugar nucleotide-binding protein [Pseudomonas chlororaphis]